MEKPKCPFCEIDHEKTRVIRKDKLVTTILSNPRLMPGHTLVIPNRHIEEPWELSNEEILAVFEAVNYARTRLLDSIATGCDVRQNYRPFIAQNRLKVDHVHFHVLPRTNEDELYRESMRFEKEIFAELTPEERTRILQLFHS